MGPEDGEKVRTVNESSNGGVLITVFFRSFSYTASLFPRLFGKMSRLNWPQKVSECSFTVRDCAGTFHSND